MNDLDHCGWGFPGCTRKAHYFAKGEVISLCGKVMYTGAREDFGHASPDNCCECKRRRLKLETTALLLPNANPKEQP